MTKLKTKPFLPTFSYLLTFKKGVSATGLRYAFLIFLVMLGSTNLSLKSISQGLPGQGVLTEQSQPVESSEEIPEEPLTRAEFIHRITHLLGQQNNHYSHFPTYRDVPENHRFYAEVEIARERNMLPKTTDFTPKGFFQPNQLITRKEALEMVERTLSGTEPSVETSRYILDPVMDSSLLKDNYKPVLAKLVYTRILPAEVIIRYKKGIVSETSEEYNEIQKKKKNRTITQFLDEPLMNAEWETIAEKLLAIRQRPYLFLPKESKKFPVLESGLTLKILPAKALFKERLGVGDDVYFTLSEAVTKEVIGITPEEPTEVKELLSKGSSIQGKVIGRNDLEHYVVRFNQIKTTDDRYYKTSATLTLEFPDKDDSFIIPTEPMVITTETPKGEK